LACAAANQGGAARAPGRGRGLTWDRGRAEGGIMSSLVGLMAEARGLTARERAPGLWSVRAAGRMVALLAFRYVDVELGEVWRAEGGLLPRAVGGDAESLLDVIARAAADGAARAARRAPGRLTVEHWTQFRKKNRAAGLTR
jgi:hypothetical protein